MASFNKVILMGNLTRDPEIRVTPGGLKIAKLGLAVNRKYRKRDSNELTEEVTFVDIDAFGQQAEILERYATKGKGLMIEGRLKMDQWQDRESGANRSKLGVVLDQFQFVGGREEGGQGGGGGGYQRSQPAPQQSRPASPPPAQSQPADNFDDDIPF